MNANLKLFSKVGRIENVFLNKGKISFVDFDVEIYFPRWFQIDDCAVTFIKCSITLINYEKWYIQYVQTVD